MSGSVYWLVGRLGGSVSDLLSLMERLLLTRTVTALEVLLLLTATSEVQVGSVFAVVDSTTREPTDDSLGLLLAYGSGGGCVILEISYAVREWLDSPKCGKHSSGNVKRSSLMRLCRLLPGAEAVVLGARAKSGFLSCGDSNSAVL